MADPNRPPLSLPLLSGSATEDFSSVPLMLGGPFVGRQQELRTLFETLAETRQGRALVVSIAASSGLGRSAFLAKFHSAVEQRWPLAWLLSGTCRRGPAHAVRPYQACAAHLTQLRFALAGQASAQRDTLLPNRLSDLTDLFPMLGDLEHEGSIPPTVAEASETVTEAQRQLGHQALRDLLDRLAQRIPMVWILDDAHWADSESLSLLADLVAPPDPPPILFLLSLDLDRRGLGFLDAFLQRRFEPTLSLKGVDLQLPALSKDESSALVSSVVRDRLPKPYISTMVESAGGSPRWLHRLATEALDLGPSADLEDYGISAYIQRRVSPDPERFPTADGSSIRQIAAISAIAGARPAEVVRSAVALKADTDFAPALDHLLDEDLIRFEGPSLDQLTWIDDSAQHAMSVLLEAAELPALYRRLAEALQATSIDHLELAQLWIHGQRPERAGEVAFQGAQAALDQKQDEIATQLLEMALDHLPSSDTKTRAEARRNLAEAWDRLGADSKAVESYLAAAQATEDESVADHLRLRAADRLLGTGYRRRGLEIISPLLAKHDLSWLVAPGAPSWFRRCKNRLRWLWWAAWRPKRSESEADPARLQAVDLCFSCTRTLGIGHPQTWEHLAQEHMVQALRAGEPYRLARAMAMKTTFVSFEGWSRRRKVLRLSHRVLGAARQVSRPHALGLAHTMVGQAWTILGQWRRALVALDRAERILESQCPQAWWERRNTLFTQLRCLMMTGRLSDFQRTFEQACRATSTQRNSSFLQALRSRFQWMAYLIDDKSENAVEDLESVISETGEYPLSHYWQLYGWVETLIYNLQGDQAWSWLDGNWSAAFEPRLGHIELLDIEIWGLRARTSLSKIQQSVCEPSTLQAMLQTANESRLKLQRIGSPWANACEVAIQAGLSSFIGEWESAGSDLERAARRFEAAAMELHAACCRFQAHRLTGKAFEIDPRQQLIELGVAAPERWADLLVPGLWWQNPEDRALDTNPKE